MGVQRGSGSGHIVEKKLFVIAYQRPRHCLCKTAPHHLLWRVQQLLPHKALEWQKLCKSAGPILTWHQKSASKLQAGLLKSHRPFADKKRWRRHFSCEPLVYCCVLARKKLKPNLPRSQLFVLLQEPKAMTTIHIWDSIWIMAPFLRFWSWCPFFGIFHPSHCT